MAPLFLTGGSGFVGRRVVALLAARGASDVRLLVRQQGRTSLPAPGPDGWRYVPGDLVGQEQPWVEALAGVDTVIHLAALTGKGSRRAHFAANLEATRRLVDAARAAGVRRFLHVSSVAAGYADRRHYHYGNAKAAAEVVVASSGLETLVVRPTMVLGPGSPALPNLTRMATLPRPLIFGRNHPVQPIHVDDLAAILVAALDLPVWRGQTVEVGGPEVVDLRTIVARIRQARGLPPRSPLALPLEPMRTLLALVEPLLLRWLPFTAGQLAGFANPIVAAPLPADVPLPRPGRGLETMLAP